MFVICNAIDQTPDHWPPHKRLEVALSHAGPSITITSFTNALAFYFGSFTSLIGLNSFCIYAGISILMLYTSVLTIFSCVMVWDLRRMHRKKGDCCFRCCSERCCLNGALLTPKQKKFSGIFDEDTDAPDDQQQESVKNNSVKPDDSRSDNEDMKNFDFKVEG